MGLASIEIFGYEDPRTRDYAVELGLALQLTNILRDVAADAARDRIYLPLEDLARFGVSEDELLRGARAPRRGRAERLDALLAFEAERARDALRRAPGAALPEVDRRSHARGRDHGRRLPRPPRGDGAARASRWAGPRVRLSRPRKAWIALRTVPRVYWGL